MTEVSENAAHEFKLVDGRLRRDDIISLVNCVSEGKPTNFSGITDPLVVLERAKDLNTKKRDYALNLLFDELNNWNRDERSQEIQVDPKAQRIISAIVKLDPTRDELEDGFSNPAFRAAVVSEVEKRDDYKHTHTAANQIIDALRKGEVVNIAPGGYATIKDVKPNKLK